MNVAETLQIMKPIRPSNEVPQGDLFKVDLDRIVDAKHPLVKLSAVIDWEQFDHTFEPLFDPRMGRPAIATRLMVGLHYLKYTYDLSDEQIVRGYTENPYWQYFCGGRYFEHELPFDPSSMSYWRKRVKEAGAERMLSESIKSAMRLKMIGAHQLKRVNVDTTVQPKNIRFPTDARLYERMRERLVKEAKKEGIALRQGYNRVAKKHLHRQSGYARAKQMKRARKETKKLKGILGRVVRDIQRKRSSISKKMKGLLELAERLLVQQRHDKNKLYSIHQPLVECIAKGKPHKPYEFGCKVSLATTAKGNWVIGSLALHQNPWDGHTLGKTLDQVERLKRDKPASGHRGLGLSWKRLRRPVPDCGGQPLSQENPQSVALLDETSQCD